MALTKNVKTGRKDAKGRVIYRGSQGGFFVINSKGNRSRPAVKEFLTERSMLQNHLNRSLRR